jgi:hypothetical protein
MQLKEANYFVRANLHSRRKDIVDLLTQLITSLEKLAE